MLLRILFSQILNCLFAIVFIEKCFAFFNKHKWLIWHFAVYFEFQTKISYEDIKTSSKVGENNSGFVKKRFVKPFEDHIIAKNCGGFK